MLIKLIGSGVGAYLLGSLPTGLFWTWLFKGIDVRRAGSGRTGGTNVWRSANFGAAFLTAVTDGLKGAAAIWLAYALSLTPWGIAVVGALAIVGHNYSLFLKFHGGAGTMVSIGVAAALWVSNLPLLALTGAGVGLLVGHASVASILIAVLLPVIFWVRGEPAYAVAFGLPAMALTLWALRPNIQRLLKGRERFLPMYLKKPPINRLSRHPFRRKRDEEEHQTSEV